VITGNLCVLGNVETFAGGEEFPVRGIYSANLGPVAKHAE
jgi:hypothetical protein